MKSNDDVSIPMGASEEGLCELPDAECDALVDVSVAMADSGRVHAAVVAMAAAAMVYRRGGRGRSWESMGSVLDAVMRWAAVCKRGGSQ